MPFVFKLPYSIYIISVLHLLIYFILIWQGNSKVSLGIRKGDDFSKNSEKKSNRELEM